MLEIVTGQVVVDAFQDMDRFLVEKVSDGIVKVLVEAGING